MGFWRAEPEDPYKRRYKDASQGKLNPFYSVGDLAERSHLSHPIGTTFLVREKDFSTNCVQLLKAPIGFEEIWNDKKSRGKFSDCSIWRPIPPTTEYVPLGYVVTPVHGGQPELDVCMCVHKSVCEKAQIYQKDVLWSSKNTSATFGNVSPKGVSYIANNVFLVCGIGEVSLWFICAVRDETVIPNFFIGVKSWNPSQIDFPDVYHLSM